MSGAGKIATAIARANAAGRPALVPFITAGFPDRDSFASQLAILAEEGDVIEIGVPFTDPLADGVTIQRSSEVALSNGVTLDWILTSLGETAPSRTTPVLLMSYLNPLLSQGYQRLASRSVEAGVAGYIVPDLPLEESAPLREALQQQGVALVQLVSPVTPEARMQKLCAESTGFVYAVTVTGVTGGSRAIDTDAMYQYLDRVRAVSPVPVCAGFGIREPGQVRAIGAHADGVIVGSALVEVLGNGGDIRAFLRRLRDG